MKNPGPSLLNPSFLRYAAPPVAVLVASFARAGLTALAGPGLPPFVTYYPAVLLVALLCGFVPGLLTGMLSVLLADYFLIEPVASLTIHKRADLFTVLFFALMCVLISTVAERARRLQQVQSEHKFRGQLEAAISSMSDAVFVSDATGNFVQFNEACLHSDKLRDTPQQLKSFADIARYFEVSTLHGEPCPAEQWAAARALRGERVINAMYALHRKDDGTAWIASVSSSPIRDANGRITGTVTVARDVTQEKEAEKALRIQGERLQLAQHAAGIGTFVLELSTLMWIDSPQMFEIFGVPPDQPFPSPEAMVNMTHPDDRELVRQQHELAFAGQPVSFERRIIRPDGEIRWVESQALPEKDGSGKVIRLLGACQDITERKQTEEELRKSENRLRLTQTAAGLGSFIMELPSQEVSWSEQMYAVYGINDRTTKPSFAQTESLTHPEDRETLRRHFEDIQRGKAIRYERRIIRPDGETRWIETSGSPVLDAEGKPVRFYGVCWDTTDRHSLQAQLQQAQKMEAIGQVAGGVAHDFNNLLGVIVGNIELLDERILADQVAQKYVGGVRKAVESATDIVRQLLAFSRKQIVRPVVLSMNNTISELSKMIQRLIGEQISISLSLDEAAFHIKADRGEIEQVLMNLILNARDAMPGGGKLSIQTSNAHLDAAFVKSHLGCQSGDFVKLSVADTGSGIPPKVMKHIFEPFFTTKDVGKGTGLGLATVYGIVKHAGGYIDVNSEPGAGTTFDIYWPAVQQPLTAVKSSQSTMNWGNETILVVEDEAALREITCARLERLGYKVIEACDPMEAIRQFDEHHGEITLLLTDVVMPGMNGRMLAEALKKMQPKLAILYMSGYTDDDMLQHGVKRAEVDLLMKPFSLEVLSVSVRKSLDKLLAGPARRKPSLVRPSASQPHLGPH